MENKEKQSVKDRILIFINSSGETKSSFEKRCNLSNGYLNQLRSSPSLDKLSDILKNYPQLNKVWLLSGEGEMLVSSTNISDSPVIVTGSNNTCNGNNINSNEVVGRLIEQMKMQFEEKDKQIEEKDRQIGRLLRLLEKANGI